MQSGRLILLAALAISPVARAAPNALLQKAATAVAELDYAEANRAIDAALKQPGNDRETLLQILQLQAIILATLGDGPKATRAFCALLALDPGFILVGNHPPRVTTAFFEARAWAAANGRLEARPLEPLLEPGAVKALRVEVTRDPLKQAKKVRFHLGALEVVSAVTNNLSAAAPKGKAIEVAWWAEVLGEKDAVLLAVGNPSGLLTARAPDKPEQPAGAPAAVLAPKAEPPPAADAPRVATQPPRPAAQAVVAKQASRPPVTGKQLVSLGLLGAGVVCGAIGSGFGLLSSGTRAQIDGAATNAAGQVTGQTQVQANELDARQRGQATAANALFVSAGVLAVTGGVLFASSFFFSGQSAAVVPTGAGLAIVGNLP